MSELTRVNKENSKITIEVTKIRNYTITLETKISEIESRLKQNSIESSSNKTTEKYSKAATVEVGKLKDMVKKLETANGKLTTEIKRLKDENAIKPDKIKTLVDVGLKAATQKLKTALDTMTAEKTKLQEEKKFKNTAQEEVYKNEASNWRTKYTVQ
jgi:predicted  nucleic acid-binding Zn-ribbon protein